MLCKQELSANILGLSGAVDVAVYLRRGCNVQWLTILAYHRVLDYPSEEKFNFDDGVISTNPRTFEKQVRYCKKNFNISTFALLKNYVETNRRVPPRSLIITFDDGYRDNFTQVFPILKKYGIPVTIFLTVDCIGKDELFWWDKVALYVKNYGKDKLDIVIGNRTYGYNLSTSTQRQSAVRELLRLLKMAPDNERLRAIETIDHDFQNTIPPQKIERQILNWDEVVEMSAGGIEFGSHSMTHPMLSQLENIEMVKHEVIKSKQILENHLNKEVTTFSYPIGGKNSYNIKIQNMLKEAGYSFAVNYVHGINRIVGQFNGYELNRLDMDKESFRGFKAKLGFPEFFKR